MDSFIDPKTAIQTAKLISFPSALFLTGYSLSLSQNTIPALYDHKPQTTAPAFKSILDSAGRIAPALTILSTTASAYLAYTLPEQRREWATAAAAMLLTFPWGGMAMMPGIKKLVAISENKGKIAKSEQSLEHRQLMIRGITGLFAAVKA
ncbi:hypothetical protein LTR37_010931 [Vermiconidia calcicola]|uniref:Uncharacterized protein n=1 Tax=Vermiconidia calcicola TaxID=1690605 RepID=A0ACC3N3R0_9PEZI|nr:hypothetical protein LTR37_010931 [Vermiconidia calcicola]